MISQINYSSKFLQNQKQVLVNHQSLQDLQNVRQDSNQSKAFSQRSKSKKRKGKKKNKGHKSQTLLQPNAYTIDAPNNQSQHQGSVSRHFQKNVHKQGWKNQQNKSRFSRRDKSNKEIGHYRPLQSAHPQTIHRRPLVGEKQAFEFSQPRATVEFPRVPIAQSFYSPTKMECDIQQQSSNQNQFSSINSNLNAPQYVPAARTIYSPTKMDSLSQIQPPRLPVPQIQEVYQPIQTQLFQNLNYPSHVQCSQPIQDEFQLIQLRKAQTLPSPINYSYSCDNSKPKLAQAIDYPAQNLRDKSWEQGKEINSNSRRKEIKNDSHTKNQEPLAKLDVFQRIETFSGGTFKFERNVNYRESLQTFEEEQLLKFRNSAKYKNIKNTSESTFKSMATQFIEEERKVLKPHLRFIKTFVPIFPSFYQNLDSGNAIGDHLNMMLYGEKELPANFENDSEKVHRVCQIKFSIKGNLLLDYEESREKLRIEQEQLRAQGGRRFSDYLLELDFKNIKKVWISRNNRHQHLKIALTKKKSNEKQDFESREKELRKYTGLDMMIELKNPCQALKFGPSKAPAYVRSPLNMTSNIAGEVDNLRYVKGISSSQTNMKEQVNYETLTNYWNQHQVFHLSGTASKADLEVFIKTTKRMNESVKIYDHNLELSELGINKLDISNLAKEYEQMKKRGMSFQEQLNQMRPSLRFSILALLSKSKFNIFNSGLIQFMDMLNGGGWNKDNTQSEYGAYVIDHINLFNDLDYKDDSNSKLIDAFDKVRNDKEISNEFLRVQRSTNLMRQRRVLVTPTLFHYTVAREEESSKVLRQFREYQDQFIRVSFVQEDFDKAFYFADNCSNLLGYIHSIMKNGFFAGRSLRNTFLSYSNSQLKNHTCWFLAQIEGSIDEKVIIDSMGSFEHEKNILKRYARRGQCFSTTKNVDTLSFDDVCQDHPDIERNGFVFSDGCGLIHPDYAQNIAKEFYLTNSSSFQIRLGGAKGILAVSNDTTLFKKDDGTEYKVLLRPSQIKFPSENLSLDIIRCATFSQGFLNRQTITLLHCLGVPTKYFLDLQSKSKEYISLENIYQRLQDKIGKIHSQFGSILQNQTQDFSVDFTFKKNKLLQDLAQDLKMSMDHCKGGLNPSLKEAILKDIDVRKEPAFSSILHSMELNQKLNLKKKARILLPDSCVLIGIVDPTDTLEEGQIFVQIRKDNFKETISQKKGHDTMEREDVFNSIHSLSDIILGKVIVTRNPCTHPGDIRLLDCVDIPELRYLYNVVVFSSRGQRPNCNKMSGGDLDGDTYFVAWDKELLSYINPHFIQEPADYSKIQLIKEMPESEDLADYFVFYLQRDVLGKVSNLWLLLADKYGQKGPCHKDCLSLSHMCSVAVDFAKHGECVSRENFDGMEKQIKEYPDFLEKHSKTKPSVPSNGVLGQLYRDIDSSQALKDFIANDWKHSIALEYEMDQNILDLVKDNRGKMHSYLNLVYKNIVLPMMQELKKCMMQFSLANEGELFASDLRFRLCHIVGENAIYSGDAGLKTEDAIQNLNTTRRLIVEKYKSILADMLVQIQMGGDLDAKIDIAVAIYLATYFDLNKSGVKYFDQNKNDPCLVSFKKQLQVQKYEDQFISKLRKNSQQYHKVCSLAEQGDHKKMRKLLQAKKLFSIPWLLVGDCILSNYPDKYDSLEYRQTIKSQIEQKTANSKITNPKQPSRQELSKMSHQNKLDKIFGSQAQHQPQYQVHNNQKNSAPVNQFNPTPFKLDTNTQDPSFLSMLNDLYGQLAQMKISQNSHSSHGAHDHQQNNY